MASSPLTATPLLHSPGYTLKTSCHSLLPAESLLRACSAGSRPSREKTARHPPPLGARGRAEPRPTWPGAPREEPAPPRPGPPPALRPALHPPLALGAARRCSLAPGCLSSGSALAPAPSAACGRGSQPIRSLAAPPPFGQQRGLPVPSLRPGGPPHPAESLTRLLSRCPQLRSGCCSLGAPPRRFLPRQLCPGERPPWSAPRSFLPSFFQATRIPRAPAACPAQGLSDLPSMASGPSGSAGKPLPSAPVSLPIRPNSPL